jgi:hypothetical protein
MVDLTTVPWLHSKARQEATKDRLKTVDVMGDGIAMAAIAIVIAYFVNSQMSNSGFFTDRFGDLEAFIFYAVAIVGFFPPALRLVLRKRNAVRPVDIVNSIFVIVAIIYLVNAFPFDFEYLASGLPSFVQSAVSWLTNDLAKMLMAFGVAVAALVTAWNLLIYLAVHQVLEEQRSATTDGKRE